MKLLTMEKGNLESTVEMLKVERDKLESRCNRLEAECQMTNNLHEQRMKDLEVRVFSCLPRAVVIARTPLFFTSMSKVLIYLYVQE